LPRRALELCLLLAIAGGCAAREGGASVSPERLSSSLGGARPAVLLGPIERGVILWPATSDDTDDEVRERVAVNLREVIAVMAPLCEPVTSCAALVAVPEPDLDVHAALRTGRGLGSLLVYRPDSMRRMTDLQVFWSVAHEYGHHIGGASRSGWAEELHADVLAGCALARSGRSIAPLRHVFAARSAPGSLENLRDEACGSDPEHPALPWHGKAVEAGAALCARGVPSRAAVDAAALRVLQAASAQAGKAAARLSKLGDPSTCSRP
jgi:hypothetical protein